MSYVYPPSAQQPRKKSKAPLIVLIIAVVLLILCGGVVACVALVSNAVQTTSPNPAGGTTVGLNQPARDGKFEFTVTSVQCGLASVGTDPLTKTAQGQYCKVSVTVKNIGDQAQMFSASNQHAYNAAGQKYDADGAAGAYLGEQSHAFLENINPGNSVNGVILFDVPADAQIVKLELHDSAFSGGVTVNL